MLLRRLLRRGLVDESRDTQFLGVFLDTLNHVFVLLGDIRRVRVAACLAAGLPKQLARPFLLERLGEIRVGDSRRARIAHGLRPVRVLLHLRA